MKTAIFKGYDEDGEVWAIGKSYGENDYETKFICPIEPTKEIVEEYERLKNVFDNSGKKVGYIGRLTRSDENFLYIFKVENETEIKRFNEKIVVYSVFELLNFIERVCENEKWKRIQERMGRNSDCFEGFRNS